MSSSRESEARDQPVVLIIDNDRAVVEAIHTRLHQAGYTCETAGGTEEALRILSLHRVALVITDLDMPGVDGLALISLIRNQSELPIIVVSGFADRYSKLISTFAAIHVVEKPFDSQALVGLVDELLISSAGGGPDLKIPRKKGIIMRKQPVVLIADDDSNLLNALRLRLQEDDFDVVTAKDSYNALAVAVQRVPDLLILDVNMPAGDGFSVQERLQKLDALREVPVIYVTGDKSQRLDDVAEQHGAIALFHKPFDSERLIATIRQVLKPKAA